MNTELMPLGYDILSFYPNNFFNKNVNENFIKLVMSSIFSEGEWVKGNANKKEPDYIYNGIPFEFTIASDKCCRSNKENFISKLKNAKYTSENVEKDAFMYIEEQLKDKATKNYSLKNVHLCVLCLLDRFDWISDVYGSSTHFLTDCYREQYFNEIKEKYIESGKFNNIFIIFPDVITNWWVWDIQSNTRTKLNITISMIESKKYPYVIVKSLYCNFVKMGMKDVFKIANTNA